MSSIANTREVAIRSFAVVVNDGGVAAMAALGQVFTSLWWFEGKGVEELLTFASAQKAEYQRALVALTSPEGEGQDVLAWRDKLQAEEAAEDKAASAGVPRPTPTAWSRAWAEHPVWVAALEDSQGGPYERFDAPIVEGAENGGWRLLTPTSGREISWDPGGRKLTVTAGKRNPPSRAALPDALDHLVAAGYEVVSAG
jgi:hypothetical protein